MKVEKHKYSCQWLYQQYYIINITLYIIVLHNVKFPNYKCQYILTGEIENTFMIVAGIYICQNANNYLVVDHIIACFVFDSVDDRICVQKEILLLENAPFPKNYTQDGLFCIYFDNCKFSI